MELMDLVKKLKMNGSGIEPAYCCECLRDLMHGVSVVMGKDVYCSRCASEVYGNEKFLDFVGKATKRQ